jgi:hypothetical protein
MRTHLAEHLPERERIQLGGYYTPKNLVERVHKFIAPYLKNKKESVVLFDSAGGCGAFLFGLEHYNYRIADRDLKAYEFLKRHFDRHNIFHTNSLKDVGRDRYLISPSAFLIMIGNPPYNDITSEFRNGEKGQNICDEDLYDRDLGISFLKSYQKLNANAVCVLHPLSYLIKKANFRRLRDFKDNYQLVRGEIFSSALFHGTGTGKFPILVALYEKNANGTTFEDISHFEFDVLDSKKKFVLSNFETTDGYINKYPPRKKDTQESPIGLYYYTFRDFNSLKKNTSFFTEKRPSGVVVKVDNFYQYAYLCALKNLFNPKDPWLYGNLSPLICTDDVEQNKKLYVSYAIRTNKVLREMDNTVLKEIANFYKINFDNTGSVNEMERVIKSKLNLLV